jgi:hypothetical protein
MLPLSIGYLGGVLGITASVSSCATTRFITPRRSNALTRHEVVGISQ